MSFNNVDLPLPFGPTSAILLPLLIFNVKSRNKYRGAMAYRNHCQKSKEGGQKIKKVVKK
jgi:hypothetical protein